MTREEIQAKIQQLMMQREQAFATLHQLTGMIAAYEQILVDMPPVVATVEAPGDEHAADR